MEVRPEQLKAVRDAAEADGVDLMVLDTRPSAESDAMAAAKLADFALLVTRPNFFDVRAIAHTVDVVKLARAKSAIVLNACPPGRGEKESGLTTEAREALAGYGLALCPSAVSQRVAIAHALISGQAVAEFEPEGRAAAEIAAVWNWTRGVLWPNAGS